MADHLVGAPLKRMNLADWDRRYRQQAGWTAGIRRYALEKAGLAQARRLLEVGCGSGAILGELAGSSPAQAWGLDLDPAGLGWLKTQQPRLPVLQADALQLPFAAGSFDLTCCHFLLLWVRHPAQALAEMRRVTRPGGWVLALAEPDYGGRIDYPLELRQIGAWQAESLRGQGADPQTGRQLAAWFRTAGLQQVECGLLGGQWLQQQNSFNSSDWQIEWQVLRDDLQSLEFSPSPAQLDELQEIDRRAQVEGTRILFVPTFYALGRVI